MKRGQRLVLGVLMIASLAGCQALPGPLAFGEGDAEVCAPATADEPWLIGDSFTTGDREIRIESVELADPVGVELGGVWLTAPANAIGAVSYPPGTDLHWGDAVDAVGTTVPPHTVQSLAFLVRPTGPEPGTAAGLAVTYSIGPFTFRKVGSVAIVLERPCSA